MNSMALIRKKKKNNLYEIILCHLKAMVDFDQECYEHY